MSVQSTCTVCDSPTYVPGHGCHSCGSDQDIHATTPWFVTNSGGDRPGLVVMGAGDREIARVSLPPGSLLAKDVARAIAMLPTMLSALRLLISSETEREDACGLARAALLVLDDEVPGLKAE
jgi:hypothetical protein